NGGLTLAADRARPAAEADHLQHLPAAPVDEFPDGRGEVPAALVQVRHQEDTKRTGHAAPPTETKPRIRRSLVRRQRPLQTAKSSLTRRARRPRRTAENEPRINTDGHG